MKRAPARSPVISLENVRKSHGDFEFGPVDLAVDPFVRCEMLDDISRFVRDDAHGGARTVVFSTHTVEEARRVADYVVLFAGGVLLVVAAASVLPDADDPRS